MARAYFRIFCKKYRISKYSVMLILCISGAIYIGFQFFSFEMLPPEENMIWRMKTLLITEVESEHHKYTAIVAAPPYVDEIVATPGETLLPRGVLASMFEDYTRRDGLFTCVRSLEKIPFERVNDDYCDCEDMSDEPGTAACPQSRFYCSFQLDTKSPEYVPASRVNDGLCDCCDGSDEWKNVTLAPSVRVRGVGGEKLGVYQTPCFDRCKTLRTLKFASDKRHQQGALLKQKYIAIAKQLNPKIAKTYGPAGVFYPLSLHCYQLRTSSYRYTVCPFHNATQRKTATSRSLGTVPGWLPPQPGQLHRLRMSGGASIQCPESKARVAVIHFQCDAVDKLVSVREDDVCVYIFLFTTPAAC